MENSDIRYKWIIKSLDAKISESGKKNVVYKVNWKYTARKGDYAVSKEGSSLLEYNPDSFIEYELLKKSDVVGWLEEENDVAQMQKGLSDRIASEETPEKIKLIPEWY